MDQRLLNQQKTESPKSNISCGVPQGLILGPLLFLIYTNDIIYCSPLLSFILFADDTNIFYSHKNFHSLITTLNLKLSKVSSWFICNKLSLNIAKTNVMLFKPSNLPNIRQNNFDIHIAGLPITEKKATKFLGVTIDSSLSWNDYIRNIHTSVSRGIGVLYRVSQKKRNGGFSVHCELKVINIFISLDRSSSAEENGT